MTIRKLLAWLILGEVEHKWQLAISVSLNTIAALIAARGQQLWWAVFFAFCAGIGLGRLEYSEKP